MGAEGGTAVMRALPQLQSLQTLSLACVARSLQPSGARGDRFWSCAREQPRRADAGCARDVWCTFGAGGLLGARITLMLPAVASSSLTHAVRRPRRDPLLASAAATRSAPKEAVRSLKRCATCRSSASSSHGACRRDSHRRSEPAPRQRKARVTHGVCLVVCCRAVFASPTGFGSTCGRPFSCPSRGNGFDAATGITIVQALPHIPQLAFFSLSCARMPCVCRAFEAACCARPALRCERARAPRPSRDAEAHAPTANLDVPPKRAARMRSVPRAPLRSLSCWSTCRSSSRSPSSARSAAALQDERAHRPRTWAVLTAWPAHPQLALAPLALFCF